MTQEQINNVTLLGAGVLGAQIAWQSAFKGKSVVVYDLYEKRAWSNAAQTSSAMRRSTCKIWAPPKTW
jgi:3-hydroxyacyl-CoA dehydrogenase